MEKQNMDRYFMYENRLASFTAPQTVTKRRASNASQQSRAPKELAWPHESLAPEEMAKAGFVFQPLPSNPDNVSCFLCNKALDGWEEDDNPLEEHLKHSPECGWAITAAVEAGLGEYAREDPRDELVMEARKATFATKWPYENKKGWACKKTQLAEAGWKYTPTAESADMATCVYCQLALDGWERGDKPWDEHYRREPDCRFFSLISSQPAPKKSARTKAARSSKASRLSIQSFANLADMSSMDATGEVDDSTLTTASKSTTASKASKKPGKTKKATNSIRAAKTRTQKDETVEIHEDEPEAEAGLPPAPLPQNTRGRKRASEEVEDSMDTNNEAPPPKKRITKTRKRRGSDATEASQADTEILDELEIVKKPAAKGKRKASGARKASGTRGRKPSGSTTGSHTTPASNASPPPQIPDDEEIDRQLQADLERPLTDEEDILADPVTEKGAAGRRSMEAVKPSIEVDNPFSQTAKADFAMFDPSPVEPSEAQIEADLQSMEDDMEVEQVEPEPQPATEADSKPAKSEIHVPKKGRTAGGVRKVSKQTALKKTKELAANIERAQARMTAEAEEPDEIAEADVSFGSAGTTLRKSLSRASLGSVNSNKGTGKRGRPRKVPQEPVDEPTTVPTAHEEPTVSAASDAMDMDDEPAQPVAEATKKRHSNGKRGRPRKNVEASDVADEAVPIEAPVEPQAAPEDTETEPEAPKAGKLPSRAGSPMKVARKPVPAPKDSPFAIRETPVTSVSKSAAQLLSMPPKTLRHQGSPAQSAKQATVSPSPSPQASDAENRPPSSKPNTHSSKRMALGDLPTATPMRQGSPSKTQHQQQQPVMGGLETREPWTAVDLDIIFQDYHGGRQNEQGAASRFFANGGELTSSERAMSVEEWIYYNAGQAEQQLKFECETMVMAFEREGTRALRVLEGLAIEEA